MANNVQVADIGVSKKISYYTQLALIKYSKATKEVATGLTNESLSDTSPHTKEILNYLTQKFTFKTYGEDIKAVKGRLDRMAVNVQQLHEIASEFKERLVKVLNFSVTDTSFNDYAQQKLLEVARLLNGTDENQRYLFSGYATDIPPVDLTALPAPALGDPVSMAYYKGTNDTLKGIISEGDYLQYGVNANESGFANLLHALKIGATTVPSNDKTSPDYQKLNGDALIHISQAITEIADSILQKIGATSQLVDKTAQEEERVLQFIEERITSLIEANIVDSYRLQSQQAVSLQLSQLTSVKNTELTQQLIGLLSNF